MKINKSKSGFTIAELLMVISIIALLGALIIISARGVIEKAKIAKNLDFSAQIYHAFGNRVVGFWDFNEGEENTCPGGEDICDSSGYQNHGNCQTGYGKWVDNDINQLGKAAEFAGNTKSYFKITPFNNFPSEEITIEFWMKSSDTSKYGTPFSYAKGTKTNEFLIYNYQNFEIIIGNISTEELSISANDGKWHHIAVAWQSSNGKLDFYKDGKLEYSGTLQEGYSLSDKGTLVFAQDQDSEGGGFESNQSFLGLIDEVRVYERALSSAIIKKHYAEGIKKFSLLKNK